MDCKVFVLAAASAMFMVSGCNKTKMGSRQRQGLPEMISINTENLGSATQGERGQGRLVLESNHELQLSCSNCARENIALSFGAGTKKGNKFFYHADYDYNFVQVTEVCELKIDVTYVQGGDKKIKFYNVYLCPKEDGSSVCVKDSAHKTCENLGK